MKDFCLVILAFDKNRIANFVPHFLNHPIGIENVDIFFIHNTIEINGIVNRYVRPKEDVAQVASFLRDIPIAKTIIERENVGEDMGAYHYAFNLLKDSYKYFFFLNEAATVEKDEWLKPYTCLYEANENIVAASPQVCTGINYAYCMPTTYWSIRSSFGKTIDWPKPVNRADAEKQEMELIYPQAKAKGFSIAQIGKGFDIKYKNTICMGEGIY